MENAKILLVQEIGTMTAELLHALRASGLEVIGVAETGDDAIRMALEKNANLAVIDTYLRVGMTAAQTADELSKLPHKVEILYITFRQDDVPQFPAYPFLLKPFSALELTSKITEILSKA